MSGILAPAVFDTPAVRLTLFIKIYAQDNHGVVHGAVAVIKSLCFGKTKLHIKEIFKSSALLIKNALFTHAEHPAV